MNHLALPRTRGILLAAGVVLAGATAAVAATPENGTVSKASPKVTWTGQVSNSYFNRVALLLADAAGQSDTVPCGPQTCDTFKLTVADQDDLTITADAPESTSSTGGAGSQVTLRITKPDGSKELHTTDTPGASPEKPFIVKFKKAPAGEWAIEYYNYFYGGAIDYNASATLGAASTAPAPASPKPGEAPPPTPGSNPQPQDGLSVDVKASGGSAKKLNKSRKLGATITVSRAVKNATAILKSGKKVVGKGKLGAFSGSKKVTLKLSKKLKAGKYSLVVSASDGAGSSATKTVALKLKK